METLNRRHPGQGYGVPCSSLCFTEGVLRRIVQPRRVYGEVSKTVSSPQVGCLHFWKQSWATENAQLKMFETLYLVRRQFEGILFELSWMDEP